MHMPQAVACLPLVLSILAALSSASFADDNPMWRSGYSWVCVSGETLTCERGDVCGFGPSPGQPLEILFESSKVKIGANSFRIKRHYSQRIGGSPLSDEVKIELSSNAVIWLTPVDAGGTWSKVWSAIMVEPKLGAVLSVSRTLFCTAKG